MRKIQQIFSRWKV